MAIVAPPAQADAPCTRVAAPSGSDNAPGTEAQPFGTAQHLVDSLTAGQAGCLRAGTYREDVRIRKGGAAGSPLTLRGFPGEHATVIGELEVTRTAPNVLIERLYLDGSPASNPSPTVNAADATFRWNDVTNRHTNICFLLGDSHAGGYGRANRVVLEHNRIHDCGKLPSTNLQHGIYVEATDGARIENNWIYDNADFGVHLYDDAQGSVIRGNVIEGNGQGVTFSGAEDLASNRNRVEGNVISGSRERFNVASWWPSGGRTPVGNVLKANCLKAGARDDDHNGGVNPSEAFSAAHNQVVSDAGFRSRGARDLRLSASSPCRSTFAGDGAEPGPDGGSTARRPGRRVTLSVRRHSVRSGRWVAFKGRVYARSLPVGLRVTLLANSRRATRVLGQATVRSGGRFTLRRRLTGPTQPLRVKALARGIGRSRSVRLRIQR